MRRLRLVRVLGVHVANVTRRDGVLVKGTPDRGIGSEPWQFLAGARVPRVLYKP